LIGFLSLWIKKIENFILKLFIKTLNFVTKKNYTLGGRTENYLKQTFMSFFYKGGALILSFLMVPLNLEYLGNLKYGIWATLFSIISWVTFFDLGLGNGMKNKVTEALSKKDFQSAREYISTAYFLIGGFCLTALYRRFFSPGGENGYIYYLKLR